MCIGVCIYIHTYTHTIYCQRIHLNLLCFVSFNIRHPHVSNPARGDQFPACTKAAVMFHGSSRLTHSHLDAFSVASVILLMDLCICSPPNPRRFNTWWREPPKPDVVASHIPSSALALAFKSVACQWPCCTVASECYEILLTLMPPLPPVHYVTAATQPVWLPHILTTFFQFGYKCILRRHWCCWSPCTAAPRPKHLGLGNYELLCQSAEKKLQT